jgi:hypothetical protein
VSYKFAFITTCMNRLEHLKVSSSQLMKDPRVGEDWLWVLVDFACPQKSGEWAENEYGERVEVVPIEPPDDPKATVVFNKPLALNSGAMHAISLGVDYLCFIDADTIVTPRFLDYLDSAASLDCFNIVVPTMEKKDLTGFLCVHHRHFLRVGGYDIRFVGWGAEDLEMRLKLYLKGQLPFSEIPVEFAESIQHGDDVRTLEYEEKDKDKSHSLNLNQLCANVFSWTGEHLLDHYEQDNKGSALRRLLGVEPFSPLETFQR